MKKLSIISGIIFSFSFYASSQDVTEVFRVSIDIEHHAVIYTQLYGVEADSVELIGYKFQALDRYLEQKQPVTVDEIKIIDDEKVFLASEKTIMLMSNPTRRVR
jgi:hypothetical protein